MHRARQTFNRPSAEPATSFGRPCGSSDARRLCHTLLSLIRCKRFLCHTTPELVLPSKVSLHHGVPGVILRGAHQEGLADDAGPSSKYCMKIVVGGIPMMTAKTRSLIELCHSGHAVDFLFPRAAGRARA